MDFAKKQLEKYGWKEGTQYISKFTSSFVILFSYCSLPLWGICRIQSTQWTLISGQGLGRNEDGISTALKPKLKFDSAGVGYNAGKDFTDDWWNNVYQSALNNIEVNIIRKLLWFSNKLSINYR